MWKRTLIWHMQRSWIFWGASSPLNWCFGTPRPCGASGLCTAAGEARRFSCSVEWWLRHEFPNHCFPLKIHKTNNNFKNTKNLWQLRQESCACKILNASMAGTLRWQLFGWSVLPIQADPNFTKWWNWFSWRRRHQSATCANITLQTLLRDLIFPKWAYAWKN